MMKPMPHLNLEISRPGGDPIFRKCFGAERLAPFVRGLTQVLVRQKVLRTGQTCPVRIIPRADDRANFDAPVVLALPGEVDDGLGELGIAFESELTPDVPLTYLTVSLVAAEAEAMYRFDLPLDTLVGGEVTEAVQQLLDKGVMKDGERFRVVVSAHGEDARAGGERDTETKKRSGWGLRKKTRQAEVRVEHREPLRGAAAAAAAPAPALSPPEEEEPDIVIGDVVQLVQPEPRSMKSYADVEAVGQIAEQDIPVFIHRAAMECARKSARVSAKSNEEVGGFFVGSVYRDPEEGRMFVDISETIETDRARGTYVSLEFNYDAWRQVLDRIEGDIRDKHLMGWYHTHLVSAAAAVPVEATLNEYVARYLTFFSSHDRFIHRNFFPSEWHVGLVLDLRCKQEVFFAWKSGEIAATQGFYLYGR